MIFSAGWMLGFVLLILTLNVRGARVIPVGGGLTVMVTVPWNPLMLVRLRNVC